MNMIDNVDNIRLQQNRSIQTSSILIDNMPGSACNFE